MDQGKASRGRKLGVVVVDALPVVRAGIVRLVADRPDMEVLADAGSADEAISSIQRVRRARVVVLVGLGIEGAHDAAWLIRTLRDRFPSYVILALGANADAAEVSRSLFVGADGFLDKNVEPPTFVEAIRRAASDEMVLEGPEPAQVGEIAVGIDRRREIDLLLTEREREVLMVAAEGLTAREMADRLGVRERTITTHLARIYGKLGVTSRLAAVRTAARSGLVSVG